MSFLKLLPFYAKPKTQAQVSLNYNTLSKSHVELPTDPSIFNYQLDFIREGECWVITNATLSCANDVTNVLQTCAGVMSVRSPAEFRARVLIGDFWWEHRELHAENVEIPCFHKDILNVIIYNLQDFTSHMQFFVTFMKVNL